MPDVHIDKLALEVPGLTPEQGRRLADMVVDGLRGVTWPAEAGQQGDKNVTVTANAGSMSLDRMAQTIVNEILRQIG